MAHYDRRSIVTFSALVVGLANLLTFACFLAPSGWLGYRIYQTHDYVGIEGFARTLLTQAQANWVMLAGASLLAAVAGYVATLALRVLGQLLLCAVQIEQNTRATTKLA